MNYTAFFKDIYIVIKFSKFRYDRNKDGRLDFDEFKELMVTNKKQPDK